MRNLMESPVTRIIYNPDEYCKIFNYRQVMFYIKNGIYPVDIYASKDYKTGEDMVVFMYNKKATQKLYSLWVNREANLDEGLVPTVEEGYSYLLKSCLDGENVVRVLNFKQVAYYLNHQKYPVEIGIMKDYKSDNCVLGVMFDKEETQDLFLEWKGIR